nr:PREDICTED: ankyrin-1-like [Bemisia tabaci]
MSNFDSPLFAAVESNNISLLSTIMQNKIIDMNELNSCGKTTLHIAVEKGFVELTKKLIEVNSNINALTPDEKTPLVIAAEGGNVALVKLLLEQPNLDVSRLQHGKTPLHIACEKGHTNIVKVLLADNRCSHYINTYFNGKAPIHIASEYGQTEILSNLLEKELDVNAVDDDGCTSLWIAIEKNQEKCAQILLKDERVDVKTRHFSQTPLERALKEKNTNISKLIIDRVGDIDITDEGGLNPLHRAVDEGMLDVVDYLIKKGANIQSKTKNGNTPLHIAAMDGHTEVAELLVENGADIHARSENYHNCTPLQFAVVCSKLEVAKFLISVGSDINAYYPHAHYAMDRGGTLLHWASRNIGEEELIRFLVENGADVNATEKDGRTPLCLLVKHNLSRSLDTMRYLIEKGATLNNARGGTPLYWAIREDYGGVDPKAADFLIEMGTDVNSCIDYHGYECDQMRTALHLARHLSTVNLLIDKGANVNAMDKSRNTPLHSAWTPSIAKCLIQHGAEVNASNESGDTPLHFVQNFHTAKILTKEGANVNASNNEGCTPLHTARNAAIAKLLLEKGAELKAVSKDGKSVLHTAAEGEFEGVPGVVEFFLQNGIDVDTVDNYGNTPLHLCGISSNIPAATVLLNNGAKINVRNKSNKRPIEIDRYPDSVNYLLSRKLSAVDQIFTAVIDNEGIEKVKGLLQTVEAVNLKQEDSQLTLLHHAVKQNNKTILRFLLQEKITPRSTNRIFPRLFKRGAPRSGEPHISRILEKINVNPPCKNNWTPLHYAAKGDDPESVTLLLQCGAAYEAKTKEGKTPLDLAECNSIREILTMADELFEAVKKGKQDLVSELVKKNNGIVNAVDSNGCSPLYFAVSNALKDITSLLLENGANVAQVTNSGSTLLHIAAAKGDAELTDTIFKHAEKNGRANVFVNAKGENGTTALHIAAQNGSVEMTKALLKHGAMYNARNKENKKPSALSRKEDVTSILNLVEESFKAGEENTVELLSRLREMELDEFFAVTNAQDYYGQTLLDYIRNNGHPFAGSEFSEIKKSKDRELLLQTNPCYYSQPPVYSQEELDDIDLGFGLFDG